MARVTAEVDRYRTSGSASRPRHGGRSATLVAARLCDRDRGARRRPRGQTYAGEEDHLRREEGRARGEEGDAGREEGCTRGEEGDAGREEGCTGGEEGDAGREEGDRRQESRRDGQARDPDHD